MERTIILLRHRPVWFTLLALSGGLIYLAWIDAGAATKLRASSLAGLRQPTGIELVLGVDPEAFHLAVLQETGRLVNVEGRHAFLDNVPAAEIDALAHQYWIADIHRWAGPTTP